MPARFIVIDNRAIEISSMTAILQDAFPKGTVFPHQQRNSFKTFHDWDHVTKYLRQFTPEPTMVLLDLSLSNKEDFDDVRRGMRQCGLIHQMFPEWYLVAYTRYATRATADRSFTSIFSGLIDKAKLDSLPNTREARGRICGQHYHSNCASKEWQ